MVGQVSKAGAQDKAERGRFPTAQDVALQAGVSAATVSRVLNGTAAVRPGKRAAVLRAADALSFVANGAARALSLRRFMAVGAVVPNIENEGFLQTFDLPGTHPPRGLYAGGHQRRLRAGPRAVGSDVPAGARHRRIDAGRGDLHRPELLARIARQAVPTVQTFTLSRDRACVGFDNAAAMTRATNYLLDLGHRRFAVITGTRRDNDRSSARVDGIVAALARRSLTIRPDHDAQASHGIRDGRDALQHILSAGGEPPTAVLCGTDQLAFGAMIEAEARGLEIPHALSVAGFNDSDHAAFLRPALTTVRMQSAEIGAAAADHLLARMAGQPALRVAELDAELILRDSTAPPPP